MTSPVLEHDLKAAIRSIPDYPKPGIMFRDITTLLGDARAAGLAPRRLDTERGGHERNAAAVLAYRCD